MTHAILYMTLQFMPVWRSEVTNEVVLAKSASRFSCQQLQALDGGRDGRVRQEGSNAKEKKRV